MVNVVSWKIIKWRKIWRKLWYKTANIKLDDISIESWVYKINIILKNEIFHWIWVYNLKNSIFESHIFDFNKDIYWEEIEVVILKKIRWYREFEWEKELKSQIKKDIQKVREMKFIVLTFGTFDIFHPWHEYYLKTWKKYADTLITIVWTDKNVKKIKWSFPKHTEWERFINVKNKKISDFVIIWDEDNPYKIINVYKPQIICLWYDQVWFANKLDNFIKKNNLDIEIIRLDSYKEDKYKSSILLGK